MGRKNKFQSQPNGWMNKSNNRRDRINKLRESLPITHAAYKVKSHPTHTSELDDLQQRYKNALNSIDYIISHIQNLVNERHKVFERYDGLVPIETPFPTNVILQFNVMVDEIYNSKREYKSWVSMLKEMNKPPYAEIYALNQCHKLGVYNVPEVLCTYTKLYIDEYFNEELDKYIELKAVEAIENDSEIYNFDGTSIDDYDKYLEV